ncbi:MAG: cation-transporting P-type ATPase, partial [Deltaproteobacteria bacterium]
LAALAPDELDDVGLYARVSPEQKLDLIARHQAAGAVVAMTGDGVNDAPALKKADIGVAMGRRGTEVAREAADMVLKDDAFSSIVAAVRHGRIIFGNIRRFVVYLLSCNVSEIMIVTGAALVRAPLPLLPLQILFLNLVTDVFPALALAFGEGDLSVMDRPPRPADEPILARRHWRRIVGYATLIAACVLATLYVAVEVLALPRRAAVTLSFLTLAFAQLWHVFNMRTAGSPLVRNDVTRNPWVWGALALCVGLLLLAVYAPGLSALLRLERPGATGWAVVLGLSAVPWAVGQALRSRPT